MANHVVAVPMVRPCEGHAGAGQPIGVNQARRDDDSAPGVQGPGRGAVDFHQAHEDEGDWYVLDEVAVDADGAAQLLVAAVEQPDFGPVAAADDISSQHQLPNQRILL